MNLFTTATLSLSAACLLAGHASADTITIREGLDGYAGTQDTWFSERTNGESNGAPEGTYIRVGQWSSANQQALLRFDGVEALLQPGGTINSATLRLVVPANLQYSDGESNAVHQMLIDWAETDAYGAATPWAGGATQHIDLDGIEAAAVATANSASYADGVTFLIPQGTVIELDVTAIVQNWANGDANYGFMFQSSGNAAGDALFMASSENATEADRPTLIIDGDLVPEPGSIALLAIGGALLARRRR